MSIRKFFLGLSTGEKWALAEASFFLGRARIETKFLSFRKLAAKLGVLNQDFKDYGEPFKEDVKECLLVKRAIQRTHTLLPWKNVCLPQSIAAMRMLARRNIAASLYFGVKKTNNKMQAHAWVKVGELFVTGQKGHEEFTKVAIFKAQ